MVGVQSGSWTLPRTMPRSFKAIETDAVPPCRGSTRTRPVLVDHQKARLPPLAGYIVPLTSPRSLTSVASLRCPAKADSTCIRFVRKLNTAARVILATVVEPATQPRLLIGFPLSLGKNIAPE